jgi:hypothetical protein
LCSSSCLDLVRQLGDRPKIFSVTPTLVLVANEPRVYRETIALALSALHPEAEVIAVEPSELDDEIERRQPDLALCIQLSRVVEAAVPTWILLYPEGANMAVVSIGGECSTTGGLALDELAAFIAPS